MPLIGAKAILQGINRSRDYDEHVAKSSLAFDECIYLGEDVDVGSQVLVSHALGFLVGLTWKKCGAEANWVRYNTRQWFSARNQEHDTWKWVLVDSFAFAFRLHNFVEITELFTSSIT